MQTRHLATAILIAVSLAIPEGTVRAASAPKPPNAKRFDALADAALTAMKQRAAELKVTGVAVVAYAPGQMIQGWTSKMAVVGKMKDPPSATEKGGVVAKVKSGYVIVAFSGGKSEDDVEVSRGGLQVLQHAL